MAESVPRLHLHVEGPDAVIRRLDDAGGSSTRVRLVDAALACLARQGTLKTTADDVAREAGLSRATLYRAFPGGRDAVLGAVVDTEVARFFSALAVAMGEAEDLEDVLVAGMVSAARQLGEHRALGYLLEHEPGVILPHLAFAAMDRVLEVASTFAAPFFGRWLDPDQAVRGAEWAVRIVVSYLCTPDPAMDLTDEADARHLVRTFVLPGVEALRPMSTAGDHRPNNTAGDHRPTSTAGDHRPNSTAGQRRPKSTAGDHRPTNRGANTT
jgi:AcrR family transcriptional regulator